MAKKVGKLKPTKSNEEDGTESTVLINSQLIDSNGTSKSTTFKTEKSLVNSNSTNIIIKETIHPTNSSSLPSSVNNGTLSSTKTVSSLSIRDKSTIKENLCKEEIVEGFAFLTFLTYSDLEKSISSNEKDAIDTCKLENNSCNTTNNNHVNKKKQKDNNKESNAKLTSSSAPTVNCTVTNESSMNNSICSLANNFLNSSSSSTVNSSNVTDKGKTKLTTVNKSSTKSIPSSTSSSTNKESNNLNKNSNSSNKSSSNIEHTDQGKESTKKKRPKEIKDCGNSELSNSNSKHANGKTPKESKSNDKIKGNRSKSPVQSTNKIKDEKRPSDDQATNSQSSNTANLTATTTKEKKIKNKEKSKDKQSNKEKIKKESKKESSKENNDEDSQATKKRDKKQLVDETSSIDLNSSVNSSHQENSERKKSSKDKTTKSSSTLKHKSSSSLSEKSNSNELTSDKNGEKNATSKKQHNGLIRTPSNSSISSSASTNKKKKSKNKDEKDKLKSSKKTPESIPGEKTLDSVSNSKLNSEEENVLDNSTSSSVQEVSSKVIKLENEESESSGANESIKSESHLNDKPVVEIANGRESNVTSISSSSTDPLTANNPITSTAGQPPPLPSTLPNPFLPTGLSQVPLFDPLFAANSQNLLRQELNNRFLATSQQERPDLLNSSPFLRPEFLMPPLLLNKFDYARTPLGLSTPANSANPFSTSLSPMIRTSTPTCTLNTSLNSSSALPARSSALSSVSTINSVPSIASTSSAASTRPSSITSTTTGLPSLALSIPSTGFPHPHLALPPHPLLPPVLQQSAQQQAQLAAFQAATNLNNPHHQHHSISKSNNSLNSSQNNQSLNGNLKKKSSANKLNLTPAKWSSMHLTIALEIRRISDPRYAQSSSSNKLQSSASSSSIEHKMTSSNKSRNEHQSSASINHQSVNNSKSLVPVSQASLQAGHLNPHLASHLGLPGLSHLQLQNSQFPYQGLPGNPNDMMKMNGLFPGIPQMNTLTSTQSNNMNNHANTIASTIALQHQPAATTLTNSTAALNRFPFPFSSPLLNTPQSLNPLLNSNPLKADQLAHQQATNSSSSPFTNAVANSLFLRPGFASPFGLTSSSIQHPGPAQNTPTSSGLMSTPNLTNDMWSRARMFSPLNGPSLQASGWSPIKSSTDQQQKLLSTSNNSSTGKSKESHSKSLKSSSNLSINGSNNHHKPASQSSFNDTSGLLRNGNLSSPLHANNSNHSSLFNTPTSFHQRPPSRLNSSSTSNSQQHQQNSNSGSRSSAHRRELDKQGFKREHSQSPSNHHSQFNNSMYHHANKLQKLNNDSPLSKTAMSSSICTPTNSIPSTTVSSMIPGFNPNPLNPFDSLPPHLLQFHPNALPNAQLNSHLQTAAAVNQLNKLPQSTTSIQGLHSSTLSNSLGSNKSKEMDAQMKSNAHSTQNGLPILPQSSMISGLTGPSPAELALLHGDPMALERAKMLMLSGLQQQSTGPYPGLQQRANNLSGSNLLTTNPLLGSQGAYPPHNPNTAAAIQQAAAMQSLHSAARAGLPSAGMLAPNPIEMQAAADAMKYLNGGNMFPGLNHPASGLPPGLLPPMPPDHFKSLTDFTRTGLGEREQLFSRYSILSSAGGGLSLTEKLNKP